MALQRRLLRDIAELQPDPYPNIILHPQKDNLKRACLILTPDERDPLHLVIDFGNDYPLKAPKITIQSRVLHPNVFNSYICVSILNTTEVYTPAYTLKGICIQLLSFFGSERIEQADGGGYVELGDYRKQKKAALGRVNEEAKIDDKASLNRYREATLNRRMGMPPITGRLPCAESKVTNPAMILGEPGVNRRVPDTGTNMSKIRVADKKDFDMYPGTLVQRLPGGGSVAELRLVDRILQLPIDIVMVILEELDSGSLAAIANVSNEIGDLIASNDFIRLCELQCFCLKESFMKLRLAVGVSASWTGRQTSLSSEFDLLSLEAFQNHNVRRSIQGLPFQHWLPLPLSRRHWQSVKPLVESLLKELGSATRLTRGPDVNVLYALMTNVVVKLSAEFENSWCRVADSLQSTLRHTSEKAIESYFSLFHLLLCLAVSQPEIVKDANDRVRLFEERATSKETCPNLDYLLTLTLISDQGLTPSLSLAIIHESVIRNVVCMLDAKGADMPELSYLEPTAVSQYRLQKTFEASRTSYRILMLQALFAKIARPVNTPISTICDQIFDRHGAPPRGTAETLANEIRCLRDIDRFPDFFGIMGVDYYPEPAEFSSFLRASIEMSRLKGYSKMPLTQNKALALRMLKEPDVERAKGVGPDRAFVEKKFVRLDFFPNKKGAKKRKAQQ